MLDVRVVQVRIQGPYGNVRFEPMEFRRIILVAGGIGITPLLPLVESLVAARRADRNAPGPQLLLLWSTRSQLEVRSFPRWLAGVAPGLRARRPEYPVCRLQPPCEGWRERAACSSKKWLLTALLPVVNRVITGRANEWMSK